jgi:hypothetical protein
MAMAKEGKLRVLLRTLAAAGAAYVRACTQQAQLDSAVQHAHSVLAGIEQRWDWQDTEALLAAAEQLQDACTAVEAALQDIAAAEEAAADGAAGGGYSQHEREAAELQAALAAVAAGAYDGGGWTAVGAGGGAGHAGAAEVEDLHEGVSCWSA